MADGDDREENEHNQRDDTPNVPIENLQISELEEPNNLEEGTCTYLYNVLNILNTNVYKINNNGRLITSANFSVKILGL